MDHCDLKSIRECIVILCREHEAGRAPSLTEVAKGLGLTTRTLQRRLRAAGTTFRVLLNELRFERAARELAARPTVDAAAIAIGFAEPTSFYRAFRRWTGATPRAWCLEQPTSPALDVPSPEPTRASIGRAS